MVDFFRATNIKRRISQSIGLIFLGEWSFYGIFRCPFAVPYIGCGQCPVVQCPGRSLWLWSWVAIGIAAMVFGRAFCGWVCPGGFIAELLASLSRFRIRVQGILAEIAPYGKQIMLAASLYFFFVLSNPRWAIPIRTGDFFNSVVLTFEHANNLWLYKSFGFLLIFFVGGIIIPRVWCRFFCPTGGLLDLINRFALIKVASDEKCVACDTCSSNCSMDTRPSRVNCTNCGSCIPNCPSEAADYSRPLVPREDMSGLKN